MTTQKDLLEQDVAYQATVAAEVFDAQIDAIDADLTGVMVRRADTDIHTYAWVLDQDDLVGNDDTKVPTQQSVKAYADAIAAAALHPTGHVGAVATGSTVVEYGDGYQHTAVITVNTTLGAIAGGAAVGLGKLLYTLPAGACIVDAAYMSIAITQSAGHINADTPEVGLGTVVASGVVAILDTPSTFENLITGQAAANCTGTATVKTVANQVFVIETGDAHAIYLNVAATWAASGDGAAVLAGTVVLKYRFMH